MLDGTRIDLVFPRSGQILRICVPDSHVELISRRNFQILTSLPRSITQRSCIENFRLMHGQPS